MIRVIFVFGVGWLITTFVGPIIGLHGGPVAVIFYAGVCFVLVSGTEGRNNSQGGDE